MGGCCHDAGFKHKEAEIVARDPVCGKKIDCEDKNALRLTHGAKVYFFCSTQCMTDFINDPRKYETRRHSFLGFFRQR